MRFEAPGVVGLADYPEQPLTARDVRLETLYSGISAGTELTAYVGTNPYVTKRWDDERRVFVEDDVSLRYPIEGWGYEEVGRIVEVGSDVEGVRPGDLVFGPWGHRSTHTAPAAWAALRVLPAGMDPVEGIFSHIGAIALNAVLDADIHLGEWVAVFGQGVPGLLVGQMARLSGATVVAVDRMPRRLELAKRLGAAHVVDFAEEDPAERIKELTGGRGADVSIEISGAYRALHSAIRSTAYNSRVVACGFFQGEASGLSLGEEFHHNRIDLVCSQISGVSPRLDHRWDVYRLQRTFIELVSEGRVEAGSLVSHTFPVSRAAEAFRVLAEAPEEAVQVVLDFTVEAG